MAKTWTSKLRGKSAALYLGVWVVIGALSAIKTYYTQLLWDKPVGWDLAFRRSFKEALAGAVCVLGVLWLCGRLTHWFHDRRGRWISMHLAGAVLFSLADLAVVSWLEAGERSVQTGEILTFGYLFEKMAMRYILSDCVVYWIIAFVHLGWFYYRGYHERERQTAALATELVQARLQALRMQLNPHFLFNTLNTISALIHTDPKTADRMVVRLSELLRRALDQGDVQEVPLRQELDFLRSYLEIERTRFADRLSVTLQIEPGTEEWFVPSLILQPLVENAIRHGIELREDMGRVEVTARRAGERLDLRVRDNGRGLPADPAAPVREGVGLSNTRSRLAHLYGSAHEFELSPMPGGGFEARLAIPLRTGPAAHAPRVVVMSASCAELPGEPLRPPAAGHPLA